MNSGFWCFYSVMCKVSGECLSLLWDNLPKISHCPTSYKIITWILISHGFLLLFFKGVSGFTSILLIDPHVLMSETVMFVALKYCFVNMSVILACEQMCLCMLPSIFSPGDGFMYMMGLSSSNESVKVDTNNVD